MLIRRETAADRPTVHAVTVAAFRRADTAGEPVEADLLARLREDAGWLPAMSLVAVDADDGVVGHVLGTRGHVETTPVVALGPLSVHPHHQRRGVGAALVHTLLGAADALGEPLVALLGDPAYYGRFGFRTATDHGVTPPVAQWGRYFQVRPLAAYRPDLRGAFAYPTPFDHL